MIAPPCCPTECTFAAPPHPARNRPAAAVMMRALVFILVGYTSPLGSSSPARLQGSFRNPGPVQRPVVCLNPLERSADQTRMDEAIEAASGEQVAGPTQFGE